MSPPETTSCHRGAARPRPVGAQPARRRARPDRGVRPRPRAIWVDQPLRHPDQPILGRPVTGGRPAAFLALEDKMYAEELWAAVGHPAGAEPRRTRHPRGAGRRPATTLGARRRVVGRRPRGLQRRRQLRALGAHPGGAAAALTFFAAHCDRVRVLPFLDGVPCSIHGIVLPDGTAVFRPVEIAILRGPRPHLHLRRAVDVLGPALRGPPRDARRGAARGRAPARHAGLRRHVRDRWCPDRRRVPADRAQRRMSAGLANAAGAVDRGLFRCSRSTSSPVVTPASRSTGWRPRSHSWTGSGPASPSRSATPAR